MISTFTLTLPVPSVFLFSGLSSLLDRWDLPVAVFPFNTVIVLYLLCTGPENPYFPHHPATPPGALETNGTELIAVEVRPTIELNLFCLFVKSYRRSQVAVHKQTLQSQLTNFVNYSKCTYSIRLFYYYIKYCIIQYTKIDII